MTLALTPPLTLKATEDSLHVSKEEIYPTQLRFPFHFFFNFLLDFYLASILDFNSALCVQFRSRFSDSLNIGYFFPFTLQSRIASAYRLGLLRKAQDGPYRVRRLGVLQLPLVQDLYLHNATQRLFVIAL
jgi:hypothetical protein